MRKLATFVLGMWVGALASFPVPSIPKAHQKAVQSDSECLASAIYHEAGGEPVAGQRAVYEVIMHRVKATKKSVCDVVKAPKQFSWVGFKPFKPFTQPMKDLLARVQRHPKVLHSTAFKWFYSGDAVPKWAEEMDCREIGGHRFCREGDKNNGVHWKVRDQGQGAEEVPEQRDGNRLSDV